MPETTTPTDIAAVRYARTAVAAAEVVELQSVVAWAAAHRVVLDDGTGVVTEQTFGDNGVLLGGVGCPLVSEFDVYDLAATLSMSSDAGCHFVGKTLELRYRLRRTWERVVALQVPKWKAFRLAELTMNLTYEAATYIDTMLAPVLHSCTYAQIERTVTIGIDLHDPDEAERRAKKAAEDRSFDVHLDGATTDGVVQVDGSLALEDALDLEQAVKNGAQSLSDLGCEESLDARRAMAVGDMARTQLALDFQADGTEDGNPGPGTSACGRGGRGVTIYAHLDPDNPHASIDNPGASDVLIEQIRAWCETVGNTVTIKPVIDLNAEITTDAYTPTVKLTEQVRLRDQCCVFPHCTRPARHCDLDHRHPFDQQNP
ncbi:HNH endonuclease, partial [Nocardioides sp.]|uniref:HNH endonuclease n=1 Tax=Nocardioides sp. TaxID=35761 RepID=UPI0032191182